MQTDDKLRGRAVISADGRVIGEIVTLVIDETSWRVASIRVALYRNIAQAIGVRHSYFQRGTLEIPVRAIQSAGDAVVLSVPVDGLRQGEPPEQPTRVATDEAPIH